MAHGVVVFAIMLSISRFDVCTGQCGGNSNACGPPPTNTNVSYTPDSSCYVANDVVTYTCAGGTLSSPTDNTCAGPSWSGVSGTCNVFTCSAPAIDSDVILTPNKTIYDALDVVGYSCADGRTLVGGDSTTCTAADTWDPATVPICEATCLPPTVENGAILPGNSNFSEGSGATVTCDNGYSLEAGSSALIMCGSDGTWDAIPRCLETCTVPNIPNSEYANGTTLNHGVTVYIDCDKGYSYQQEVKFEVTCNYGGLRATTVLPTECIVDCPAWANPANGNVTITNRHGSTAKFSCNRGYAIANHDDVTSMCNRGEWDITDPPECVALEGENRVTLTCGSEKFRIEIPVDLVNADNVDLIHLEDRTCIAQMVPGQTDYLYLSSTYGDCGTAVQVDTIMEQVTYTNRVEAELSRDGLTSQQRPLDVNIQCNFDQSNLVSTSVIIANNITSALSIFGHYFSLSLYKEDSFALAEIPPIDLYGDNPVFVKLQLEADKEASLVGSDCHVTPSNDPRDPVYRDLLRDGCAVDNGVKVLDISSQLSRPALAFSMPKVQFDGNSDQVYIHCYATTCEGDSCATSCPSTRRRRSLNAYQLLTEGPIVWHPETTADRSLDDGVVMALLLVSGIVSTVSLVIVIFVAYRCLRRKPTQTKVDLYG